MKKVFVLAFALLVGVMQAQEKKEPTFEAEGDLVKATYYHENGSVHKQGFFKNKKLTGMWTEFDSEGNKTALGFYNEGKKVGKWFQWHNNLLREITFKDNSTIANVSIWREDVKIIASNK